HTATSCRQPLQRHGHLRPALRQLRGPDAFPRRHQPEGALRVGFRFEHAGTLRSRLPPHKPRRAPVGVRCRRAPPLIHSRVTPHRKICLRDLTSGNPPVAGTLLPSRWRRIKTKNNKSRTIMTTLEIKGDWNITKGKLKQKWAKLTDDDLQYAEGKQEELVGRIQKRTGETREAVEKALKESCSACGCK